MSFDIFRIVADLHQIGNKVSRQYGELRRETLAYDEEPYADLAALKESLDRSIKLAERMAVGAGAANAKT